MGKQVKCGSTHTKTGKRCQNPAMIGYSRCQLHRGEWNPPQKKKTKKRQPQAVVRFSAGEFGAW
ncbi:hypothetical protein [Streptomyces canus]|nr:hypothetical protein [Streptomyces canus]MDQ0762108.1 hypothetical protein [Streptomyces canus]